LSFFHPSIVFFALTALTALSSSSCTGRRSASLEWTFALACPALAEPGAVLEVQISEGGCGGEGEVRYQAELALDGIGVPPPRLAAGPHAAQGVLRDTDGLELGQGCVQFTSPVETELRVPIEGSDGRCGEASGSGMELPGTVGSAPSDPDGGAAPTQPGADQGDGSTDPLPVDCVAAGSCTPDPEDRDGDQVANDLDAQPDDVTRCRDMDADGCDDCALGAGPSVSDDGPDQDGDGRCDAGDDDDDGDSVADVSDAAPLDPRQCQDSDGDGCDDCALAGRPEPSNDGFDGDGDGLCTCVYLVAPGARDTQDGSSWERAFSRPADAVRAAAIAAPVHGRCEVWLAGGTYHLYEASSQDSLALASGVDVLGGYAGTELLRDPEAYPSILDGSDSADATRRVQHVVRGADDALLDGVVVQGGAATGALVEGSGGGMWNVGVSPTVRGSTFRDNNASVDGGAVYNQDSAARFENTLFLSNVANGVGGGMSNLRSSVVIEGCRFEGNQARAVLYGGGALTNVEGSDALVSRTVFFDNQASFRGGAIHNRGSSPLLSHCTIVGNVAGDTGGGIRNYRQLLPVPMGSVPIVRNSIVWANSPEDFTLGVLTGMEVRYSNVGGLDQASLDADLGNLSVDPMFTDPEAGDLSLSAASPCIDAAEGGIESPWQGGGGGPFDDPLTEDTGAGEVTHVDMGAIEYRP